MAKKTISVEIESSGYDLSEALVAVVAGARKSGAAGALEAAVASVVAIVQAAEALPADAKEDLWELERGLALGASDLAKAAFGPAAPAAV